MASTQLLDDSEREVRRQGPLVVVRPAPSRARWEPGPDRPDPVEILEEQDRTRIPELIAIRHGRMLASPFTFYRGAAGIMAADLGVTPRSGLDVQLCGDAHLSNFGVFAAPDRRLIFDINDFDETHPGAVRMGHEAACRELRGRRPRSRFQQAGAAGRGDLGRTRVPGGDQAACGGAQHRRLVRASRSRRHRAVPLAGEPQGRPQLRQGEGEGREQEQPARARQAHP